MRKLVLGLLFVLIFYGTGYIFYRKSAHAFLASEPNGILLTLPSIGDRRISADMRGKVLGDLRHNNQFLFLLYSPVIKIDPGFRELFK